MRQSSEGWDIVAGFYELTDYNEQGLFPEGLNDPKEKRDFVRRLLIQRIIEEAGKKVGYLTHELSNDTFYEVEE